MIGKMNPEPLASRRLLYIVPFALFVAIAAYLAIGLTRDPARIPSALIDRPIPEIALPPLPGVDVPGFEPGQIRGKVALVNVFASWCVPCKVEHPVLMRLSREGRLAVYGINYRDWHEDAASWLKNLGNPYLAIGYDESGRGGIEWGVYGVPETFVIDRTGRIRYKQVGPITPDVLEGTLMPLIRSLEK